jgi:sugar lactone lactonase YvrE
VYVTETVGNSVRRIDPYTSVDEVVVEEIIEPNGLAFSPDFHTLYIGSGCDKIYTVHFDDAREPEPAKLFLTTADPLASGAGMSGCLAGMGVDSCGNLYVLSGDEPRLFRVAKDASAVTQLVDLRSAVTAVTNIEWGRGAGGFFEDAIYIACSDDTVFEIRVDVTGKGYAQM